MTFGPGCQSLSTNSCEKSQHVCTMPKWTYIHQRRTMRRKRRWMSCRDDEMNESRRRSANYGIRAQGRRSNFYIAQFSQVFAFVALLVSCPQHIVLKGELTSGQLIGAVTTVLFRTLIIDLSHCHDCKQPTLTLSSSLRR